MMDEGQERVWERGWDGHDASQKRRLARLPLAARIAWLEEAQELARFLQRRRRPEGKASVPDPSRRP